MMRKILGVVMLITALTCPAYAGEMPTDNPGRPMSNAPGVIQNDFAGDIQNGFTDEMTNGVTATSDIQGAQIALSLLQSLLALF